MRNALRDGDAEARRLALWRWAGALVAWQVVVLAAIGISALALRGSHPVGWLAPPLGLVLGTAMAIQPAVFAMLRAAARG